MIHYSATDRDVCVTAHTAPQLSVTGERNASKAFSAAFTVSSEATSVNLQPDMSALITSVYYTHRVLRRATSLRASLGCTVCR